MIPVEYGDKIAVRLIGVKAGNLIKEGFDPQLSLFAATQTVDDIEQKNDSIERHRKELIAAMDSVQDKYGDSALKMASLIKSQEQ